MSHSDKNGYLLSAILTSLFVFITFFVAITKSDAGAIAQSLGGLIGGAVGAAGAVASVVLLFERQRMQVISRLKMGAIVDLRRLHQRAYALRQMFEQLIPLSPELFWNSLKQAPDVRHLAILDPIILTKSVEFIGDWEYGEECLFILYDVHEYNSFVNTIKSISNISTKEELLSTIGVSQLQVLALKCLAIEKRVLSLISTLDK